MRSFDTLDLRHDGGVLRGAGGHFCAGADLKDIAAARAANADALAETNARFGAFLQKRKPNWAPQ